MPIQRNSNPYFTFFFMLIFLRSTSSAIIDCYCSDIACCLELKPCDEPHTIDNSLDFSEEQDCCSGAECTGVDFDHDHNYHHLQRLVTSLNYPPVLLTSIAFQGKLPAPEYPLFLDLHHLQNPFLFSSKTTSLLI